MAAAPMKNALRWVKPVNCAICPVGRMEMGCLSRNNGKA